MIEAQADGRIPAQIIYSLEHGIGYIQIQNVLYQNMAVVAKKSFSQEYYRKVIEYFHRSLDLNSKVV